MKKIDVLVVDGNREFANSLKDFLDTISNVNGIGLETTVEKGLKKFSSDMPDLLLLDSRFMSEDTEAKLAQARSELPDARVCLLSVFEGDLLDEQAQRLGADKVLPRIRIADDFDDVLDELFGNDL